MMKSIKKTTNKLLVTILIISLIIFCFSIISLASTYTNPIVHDIADMDVLYHNGMYYMYGTRVAGGSYGFEVHYSSDMVNWTKHPQLALTPGPDNWGSQWFWAPDVKYRASDGMFYMNYTADTRMYVAKSSSPLGPFTKHSNGVLQNYWSIDSNYFRDDDGQEYIYFNTGGDTGVWVGKFASDMKSIHSVTYCFSQQTHPESWVYQGINEAAYMLKRNGTYYLFYSGNGWGADYAVGYATSSNPTGPWTKNPYNPVLSKSAQINGPGHNSFAWSPDGTELFMIYHRHYNLSQGEPRKACMDRVNFLAGSPPRITVTGPTTTAQPAPSTSSSGGSTTPVKAWEFTANVEGWAAFNHISGFGWQTGGYVGGNITGGDPYILSSDNLGVPITNAKTIKIRMKNSTASTTAQIYFTTNADTSFNETKSKNFTINANDSNYTEYTIDMSSIAGWTGTLKRLRIDPSNTVTSGSFSIDHIRIYENAPAVNWEYTSDKEGWTIGQQVTDLNWQTGGYLGGNISGTDPRIVLLIT